MELFWEIVRLLTRYILTFTAAWLTRRVASSATHVPFERYVPIWLIVIAVPIACAGYDAFHFYYISPIGKLPLVATDDFREVSPITEAQRGVKTLQWMVENPGADLIAVRLLKSFVVVLAVSPEAHRDVLCSPTGDFVKPEAGRAYLSALLGNGLILSEGDEHKYQRKVLTPSFRIQNIRSLQPLIADKTNLMLSEVKKAMAKSGSIEISSWASRLTMDIIGPSLMSKDFQSLTHEHSQMEEAFATLINPSAEQSILFLASFLLPQWIVGRLPMQANKTATQSIDFVRNVCTNILAEKRATEKGKFDEEQHTSDILGSILSRGGFTDEVVIDQMITFLAAGHETTASSIAWATHLLTLPENAHYQVELRDEIQEAMSAYDPSSAPADGILPYSTLEALPLLNGICEETLRLFPPVTNTGRKAIRNTVVAGVRIPKGSVIVISPWSVNRNPAFWGDRAADFVPERWIETLPDGKRRLDKSGGAPSNMCVQTFLHGNRACIGQAFAKAELRYILAALCVGNQLRRLPGDNGVVTPAGSLTIKPAGGLRVTVTPWKM